MKAFHFACLAGSMVNPRWRGLTKPCTKPCYQWVIGAGCATARAWWNSWRQFQALGIYGCRHHWGFIIQGESPTLLKKPVSSQEVSWTMGHVDPNFGQTEGNTLDSITHAVMTPERWQRLKDTTRYQRPAQASWAIHWNLTSWFGTSMNIHSTCRQQVADINFVLYKKKPPGSHRQVTAGCARCEDGLLMLVVWCFGETLKIQMRLFLTTF